MSLPRTVVIHPNMEGDDGALAAIAFQARAQIIMVATDENLDLGMVMSAVLSGVCSIAGDNGQQAREGWAAVLDDWARIMRSGTPITGGGKDAVGQTVGNA